MASILGSGSCQLYMSPYSSCSGCYLGKFFPWQNSWASEYNINQISMFHPQLSWEAEQFIRPTLKSMGQKHILIYLISSVATLQNSKKFITNIILPTILKTKGPMSDSVCFMPDSCFTVGHDPGAEGSSPTLDFMLSAPSACPSLSLLLSLSHSLSLVNK